MDASHPSQSYGSQATASQRRRRPRCPQCGSNRYRRDPSTSLVVCESGHVLQGFRDEEAQDGDEFNTTRTQMHRRTLKVQGLDGKRRVGRKKMSVATMGVWYGARSRYLHFQALQLILRLQIQALMKEMPGLPAEIEPVCRDLWALYVSQKIDLIAQPYLEEAAKEENKESTAAHAESSQDGLFGAKRSAQAERDAILAEEWEESQVLRDQLREIGVIEEQDELQSQTEGTERGATSTEWESAWDQESGEEDNKDMIFASSKRRQRGKWKHKHKQFGQQEGFILQRKNRGELESLLGILHLGLITLRVPITWSDLCTLIRAGRLPYLNVVHQLPAEMVKPFPARAVKKLDPSRVPSIQRLHRKTIALATDLYEVYGIEFPELNSLPILWRYVERLLLPPTFYSAAKSLLAYIDVSMHTVSHECAAGPHWQECEEESRQRRLEPGLDAVLSVNLGQQSTAREIVIMAALVVVLKMRFGLDGEERYEDFEEPAWWSGAPSLVDWLSAVKKLQEHQQSVDCTVYKADGLDLLDMNEFQLDAYLAYTERTLILSQNPLSYRWRRREDIGDLFSCAPRLNEKFPLDRGSSQRPETNAGNVLQQEKKSIEASLQHLYTDTAPKIPPMTLLSPNQSNPGDAHSLYSAKETTDLLPPEYNLVLTHSSRIVGCQDTEMAAAVRSIEVALIKKLVRRRRMRELAERKRRRDDIARPLPQPSQSQDIIGALDELIPMSAI